MNEERIIYIVIDPSKARRGASAVVDSLNGIHRATDRVNNNLRASDRAMQGFARNFGRLQALLITAQPVRFLSGFLRSLVEADKTVTTFKSQMYTVTGDLQEADEAFEHLKDTAQAYAVPINSITKGFAKLKASMNTPELEQYNEALFQSTVVLSSVLHLAEYNAERVFNVMIQIMSKGQLMMEELKQQLGEHVPGAIALAAESMGMSVADMMDKMQKGLISAEQFAAGWSELILERFGPAVEVATKSIQAAVNRFNNVIQASMIDLTENEAGFAIARLITTIVERLDSAGEYFKIFGKQIAEVALDIEDFVRSLQPKDIEEFFSSTVNMFKAIIDVSGALASGVLFLSKYKDEVTLLIKVILAAWAATKTYTAAIWAFNTALAASRLGVASIAMTFATLMGVVSTALAGLVGYSIGTWLYDEFVEVKKAGNRIALVFTWLAAEAAHVFDKMGERIKFAFSEPLNAVMSTIKDVLDFFGSMSQGLLNFLGFDIDKDNLPTGLLAKYIDEHFEDIDDKLAAMDAAHEEAVTNIFATYGKLFDDLDNPEEPDEGDLLKRLGLPENYRELMEKLRNDLQDLNIPAFEGNGGSGVTDDLLGDEEALRQSLETREEAILRSYQDTQLEIERIAKEVGLAEKDQLQLSERNYREYNISMLELQEERLKQQVEAEKTYWDTYLENMKESLMTGTELSINMMDRFSSAVGDAFEDMVFEFTTFEEAFKSLMEGMLRALVNAIGEMIAQWLMFRAMQLAFEKTTATQAALAMTQEALAAQQMAALNSYASTAAIPIVGPAAAPAAAAASYGFTAPLVAAVSGLMTAAAGARAMGGQVQEGKTYLIGERGPELWTAGGTGHVTPNHQIGGGSTNVTQVFQMSDNARREAKQAVLEAAPFIKQLAKQAIMESATQGGAMSRTLGRRS